MSPPSSFSAFLDVIQGPLQGQALPLVAPQAVAGRDTDCELALSSYREVSRRHARFYLRGGTWCVEDLGSTNGTFVNNVRATPSFSLTNGTQIQMGDFQARFRLAAVGTQPTMPGATQMSPLPVAPIPPVQVAPVTYPSTYPTQSPKNPAIALLLSFLFSGLGQIYNEEPSKGIPMIIGGVFGWMFSLLCFLGFPALLALWVWGMVDAYQDAERINRERSGQRPY